MKRINYALLYLKRNIKTTALISLVFFVLINLILIAAILSDLTLFAKDKTIEGIDYSASIDSELCNGKYLSYDKDIHQNINGLKDDLDDLKSEDVQVSYHIITNAYSTELFFPDDGVSDLSYNEQRFFGIDEADLSKIASINDLSDDEVIVPAGYHYEDGTMVQIGDELTYDLPIFYYDYNNFKDIIAKDTVRFKVAGFYEINDEDAVKKRLYVTNDTALAYYDRLYQLRQDNLDKMDTSMAKMSDGAVYQPNIYAPQITCKDYDTLKKTVADLEAIAAKYTVSENDKILLSLKVTSTIDEAMKIINSISGYSMIVGALLVIVIVLVIIALYFILNIFIKERQREFAIKLSLGYNLKKLKRQYFGELLDIYLPVYSLSLITSFFLSQYLIDAIRQVNYLKQRDIYIAENRLNELKEVEATISAVYDLSLKPWLLAMAFIIGLLIIRLSVKLEFHYLSRHHLNSLLRSE